MKFLKQIDTVIMGKNCYLQGQYKEFSNQQVYVATSEKLKDFENIHFIRGDISKIVEEMGLKGGRNIFIFGGGELVNNFLKTNSIDEYYIGIVPTILGSGRKLFPGNSPPINLHLIEIMSENGIVVLHYVRRTDRKTDFAFQMK